VSRKSPRAPFITPPLRALCYRVQRYVKQIRKRWNARREKERNARMRVSISMKLSAVSRSCLVLCRCGSIVNSSRICFSLASLHDMRKRERDREKERERGGEHPCGITKFPAAQPPPDSSPRPCHPPPPRSRDIRPAVS